MLPNISELCNQKIWPDATKYLLNIFDLVGPKYLLKIFDVVEPKYWTWWDQTAGRGTSPLNLQSIVRPMFFVSHLIFVIVINYNINIITNNIIIIIIIIIIIMITTWPSKWCCGDRTCVYCALTVGKTVATPELIGCNDSNFYWSYIFWLLGILYILWQWLHLLSWLGAKNNSNFNQQKYGSLICGDPAKNGLQKDFCLPRVANICVQAWKVKT